MHNVPTVCTGTLKAGLCLTALLMIPSVRSVAANSTVFYRHRLEALRAQLLTNYSRHFGPFREAGEALPVKIRYTLSSIVSLNTIDQMLTTLSYLQVTWNDPELAWNVTDVGSPGEGISSIDFSSDDLWIPRIVIFNIVHDDQVLSRYHTITVRDDGSCEAHVTLTLVTTCQMDVAYYPFDLQMCWVIFLAPYGDSLNLTGHMPDPRSLAYVFDVSGEWDVLNITSFSFPEAQLMFPDSNVAFLLILRRRSEFYLLTVLFPMMILPVTGSCGFLLPLQCGEKVSFQVAIMVSLCVFLTFINDSIPKTSISQSRLALYLDMLLLLSCLSLLATLTVLRGHFHHEKLDREDKEQGQSSVMTPADDQNMDRTTTTSTVNVRVKAVSSGIRRFWRWLGHVTRRWYCCFCCVPPKYLDIIFFILFLLCPIFGLTIFFM